MKDYEIIELYHKGKKHYYINVIMNKLLFSIINIGIIVLIVFLKYKWFNFNVIIYCFLIQFAFISIVSIVIVPKKWDDIQSIYHKIQ